MRQTWSFPGFCLKQTYIACPNRLLYCPGGPCSVMACYASLFHWYKLLFFLNMSINIVLELEVNYARLCCIAPEKTLRDSCLIILGRININTSNVCQNIQSTENIFSISWILQCSNGPCWSFIFERYSWYSSLSDHCYKIAQTLSVLFFMLLSQFVICARENPVFCTGKRSADVFFGQIDIIKLKGSKM